MPRGLRSPRGTCRHPLLPALLLPPLALPQRSLGPSPFLSCPGRLPRAWAHLLADIFPPSPLPAITLFRPHQPPHCSSRGLAHSHPYNPLLGTPSPTPIWLHLTSIMSGVPPQRGPSPWEPSAATSCLVNDPSHRCPCKGEVSQPPLRSVPSTLPTAPLTAPAAGLTASSPSLQPPGARGSRQGLWRV